MYKKLDENDLNQILETGIDEFAKSGLDRANINTIAKEAGVSVGVIYKYYGDKDGFFLACVRHSLSALDKVLQDAVSCETDVLSGIRSVIRSLIEHARAHPSHNAMYNEISAGSCKPYARALAQEIERPSAGAYTALISQAQAAGRVDAELSPAMFAFFIDNLLMMLQFSYSCDYYRERMKIFCGEDIFDDTDKLTEEFMRFIRSALKATGVKGEG